MNEEMQQALLLSQIQKKRALKEQYLYGSQPDQQTGQTDKSCTLTKTVMANLTAFAIREHVNVFALMEELCKNPEGQNLFDSVLSWIEAISEVLELGAYQLFIDDVPLRRKILSGLLARLRQDPPDNWEDIRIEESGDASFTLPGFDEYWPMKSPSRHQVRLVFQRKAMDGGLHYGLVVEGSFPNSHRQLLPEQGLLWEEPAGNLADFIAETLSALQDGWFLLQMRYQAREKRLLSELYKLRDLAAVLEECPEGLKSGSIFAKEACTLDALRKETQEDYTRMPPALKDGPRGQEFRSEILLLGGAINRFHRAAEQPDEARSALSETIYLLEGLLELQDS